MDIEEIKLQYMVLEAQRAGIEKQMEVMAQIKCGKCTGGQIMTNIEGNTTAGVSSSMCKICEGTGRAIGILYKGW